MGRTGSSHRAGLVVIRLQSCLADPSVHTLARRLRDFEPNGSLRLPLHHCRSVRDLGSVANITDAKADQAASTKLDGGLVIRKWPWVLMILRNCMFRLSMALVV